MTFTTCSIVSLPFRLVRFPRPAEAEKGPGQRGPCLTPRKYFYFLVDTTNVVSRSPESPVVCRVSVELSAMGKIEWAMWANEQALASGLSE